ncbi:hypothetical protein MKX01_005355 [Papaver californicum]|nr:hypothetical protein MKX01_005355 [Papaver californicum]
MASARTLVSNHLLGRTSCYFNDVQSKRMVSIRVYSSKFSPPSKGVVYEQHGSHDEVTRVIDLPPVEIKEKDVCVKMLTSLINPSDINRIQGVYPVRPPLPAVGGYEGVGEVHDFGSVVKGLSLGDLVIPSPPSYAWQTYVVKEESMWHKVDPNWSMALLMLDDFVKLNAGDVIVKNGSTSIVGHCIIQLAKLQDMQASLPKTDKTSCVLVSEGLNSIVLSLF